MKNIKIIYWTGTGNTEIMANTIGDYISNDSNATIEVISVADATQNTIDNASHIILGCPSMGAEVLEETEFEPFINSTDFTGKNIALFGSYGWGDGEWMRSWETQMVDEKSAYLITESLILNETPDEKGILKCKEFAKVILQS